MIEKVIASILDAEKEASDIVALGMKEYKKIISDAESQAEKSKKELVSSLKATQALAYSDAEKQAEANYQNSLEAGRVQAKELKAESLKKTDQAVEFIIRKVI